MIPIFPPNVFSVSILFLVSSIIAIAFCHCCQSLGLYNKHKSRRERRAPYQKIKKNLHTCIQLELKENNKRTTIDCSPFSPPCVQGTTLAASDCLTPMEIPRKACKTVRIELQE